MEEAPRTGVEGACSSPPRSVVIATPPRSPGGDPGRGTDPSSSRGPARDPSEPNHESWALVAGRPTGGGPSCSVAIQAVQRCLDQLEADLAAEEGQLAMERARLAEA
jgi:hypothetical protein